MTKAFGLMIKTAITIAALIAVASIPVGMQSAHAAIPDVVKLTIQGWANGDATDDEFISALESLVATDVLRLKHVAGVDSLTFAFTPVKPVDLDDFTPNAETLADFLESQLGADVEISTPTSYEPIIEGLRFGTIDAAIMDTGPGWLAHSKSGAEVVMAEVVGGKIYYQATAWVSADTEGIDSIDDALGKKVSFTSQTGSSGFVRPFGSLVSEGYVTIDGDDAIALQAAIDDAFESHAFPGSYGGAADLLARGQVDIAFGNDRLHTYLDVEDRGLIKPAFTIGPVPSHVLVVSSTMSENTKKALVDAMLLLNGDQYGDILYDLYEAEAMLPTTTKNHLASFGANIDAIVGFDQVLLDKYRN